MADDNYPVDGSWSHWDAFRHWMYHRLDAALQAHPWDRKPVEVLEFGSREPTTPIIRMLKYRLGAEQVNARCAPEYPDPLGDVTLMSQPSACCDLLILDQVLEHVTQPWLVPDNLYRMLRPGGVAIVTTPFMFPLHYCPTDNFRYTPQTYENLFPADQWQVLQAERWGGEQALSFWLQNGRLVGWVPIDEARAQCPGFNEPDFGTNFPMVVWWMGQKR